VGLVRKYAYLVEKYVEGVRYKRKREQPQIRFRSFGEKRRTKRREEFVEPYNPLI